MEIKLSPEVEAVLEDYKFLVIESKHKDITDCEELNFFTENGVSMCEHCGQELEVVWFKDLDVLDQLFYVANSELDGMELIKYTITGLNDVG